MPRSSSPGRALLVLAALILAVAVVFDLARPVPFLVSAWRSLHRGEAPVERLLNDAVEGMGPRR